MKVLILCTVFIFASCSKKGGSSNSASKKVEPQTPAINAQEFECMDKLNENLDPKDLSDIANLSHVGLKECKLSEQQVITFIKELRGIENES